MIKFLKKLFKKVRDDLTQERRKRSIKVMPKPRTREEKMEALRKFAERRSSKQDILKLDAKPRPKPVA